MFSGVFQNYKRDTLEDKFRIRLDLQNLILSLLFISDKLGIPGDI